MRTTPPVEQQQIVSSLAFMALLVLCASPSFSQPHQTCNLLWKHTLDTSLHAHYLWMNSSPGNFTGIAYDQWRDVLYVVNPELCNGTTPCPRVHVWNASTGEVATSIGRALNGSGGQLPVPVDTISAGNMFGRYALYKIDLDDEGRIYSSNLVSPIWNPPFGCFPPDMTNQGPLKIYRWNTPSSTPTLIYSTLDSLHENPGTNQINSEMTWSRWGDAFDVVGKRGYRTVGGGQPPVLDDSTRIFVSGGYFLCQPETNREVNVFLADTRSNAPFPFRLGIRLKSSLEGIASHGLAATGPLSTSSVWMDNNTRVTTLNNQNQSATPFPQIVQMVSQFSLSGDTATGTGYAGPIAFLNVRAQTNRSYLICADGRPSDLQDFNAPNAFTTARVMDVTNPSSATLFLPHTPMMGLRRLDNLNDADGSNFIADVDYRLEPDIDSGLGYFLTVFVLMSNNGIAAYRTRRPVIVPVELMTFHATLRERDVHLAWTVASENNNAGFDVQRSFSLGREWETIDFVMGRGTTSVPASYTVDDPLLEIHRRIGRVQYRLRQVDADGSFNYSSVEELLVTMPPETVYLGASYPNPASAGATITFRVASDMPFRARLLNALGEPVRILSEGMRNAGMHMLDVPTNGIPSGMYIIEFVAGGQTLQRRMQVLK